jgi:hypothetical protein
MWSASRGNCPRWNDPHQSSKNRFGQLGGTVSFLRAEEGYPMMPRPRPPYLHRYKTRHGKMIWYLRKGPHGRRIRIRAEYDTPEFQAEYQAAINDTPAPAPKIKASKGTLEWAWLLYRQSAAWQSAISNATRRQRENIMKHVLATAGSEPLSAIIHRCNP